jgi:Ribbon-helix-helix protein, copG family
MALKSVMIQLRPEQIEALDRHADKIGASRSRLIREAVDAALAPAQQPDLVARYAAAYPVDELGIGELGVDEWGSRDQWHAAAAERRLNDANAARDPW